MGKSEKQSVLLEKEREFFFKNGYLLIKNVYNKNDLNEARNFFKSAFEKELWKDLKYNSPTIINDIYKVYPKLTDIIINEKYVSILKSILGERIIWLPECSVHHNRFANWHNDTTEQEIKGIRSHKNPNEFLLQCATYFQSNSEVGGGLTVVAGSHLTLDPCLNLYKKDIYHRIINKAKKIFKISVFDKLDKHKNAVQIPCELGDLVIFDVRLNHKATGNNLKSAGIEKFAVFNTFGTDNMFTKDYLEFMKKRPEPYYQFMQNTPIFESLYKKAASLDIEIWE